MKNKNKYNYQIFNHLFYQAPVEPLIQSWQALDSGLTYIILRLKM